MEAALHKCYIGKLFDVFWEKSQKKQTKNKQKNNDLTLFYYKELPNIIFLWEFSQIFQKSCFLKQLWMLAFETSQWLKYIGLFINSIVSYFVSTN